ncbi:MAG: hypothetical protein AB7Q29_01850 [Vicinamibacterales bacterium]
MQQRQPRLGDILDDYCPRERRLTNHAVVAMVGDAVKQTRCTTCESEHEYKHAHVPKPRKKPDQSLYSQVLAGVAPKRVTTPSPAHEEAALSEDREQAEEPDATELESESEPAAFQPSPRGAATAFTLSTSDAAGERYDAEAHDAEVHDAEEHDDEREGEPPSEEGPVHRQLIRAQLPRHEGQVATTRQAPDFTIRMPTTGRANRFRPRQQRGGQQFQGNRGGGAPSGGHARGAGPGPGARPQGGRPQDRPRSGQRRGSGRNRPK